MTKKLLYMAAVISILLLTAFSCAAPAPATTSAPAPVTAATATTTLPQPAATTATPPATTLSVAPTPSPTTAPAPAQTAPPDPPASTTSAIAWSPDGVISAGEYKGTFKSGDYELYWTADAQYIYAGIKAKTTGWVSVAVQPGVRMKNADMLFGFVKDGALSIYDMFSTGDFGPHPPDTEQGGKDDILESGGSEAGGFTTIEFKRALDTGDSLDHPLKTGSNKIIWAYGAADGLMAQHAVRGYSEINL